MSRRHISSERRPPQSAWLMTLLVLLTVWPVGCSRSGSSSTTAFKDESSAATGQATPPVDRAENAAVARGTNSGTSDSPESAQGRGANSPRRIDLSLELPQSGIDLSRPAQRTFGIVIGAAEYRQMSPLPFAAKDAEDVADALIRAGASPAHVLRLTDRQLGSARPNYHTLLAELPRWLAQPQQADTVLVFFAGHGVQAADGLYLAPTDIELRPTNSQKPPTARNGVSLAWLRAELGKCAARTKVLILDACHSGSLRSSGQPPVDSQKIAKAFEGLEGLVTIASCAASQQSFELKELGNGLFTHWLLRGIGGEADLARDGDINIDELYGYLHNEVARNAAHLGLRQTPVRTIFSGTGVPVVIKLSGRPASQPGGPPQQNIVDATAPHVEPKPTPSSGVIDKLPCAEVLQIAMTQSPPGPPAELKSPRLELAVLARKSAGQPLAPIADGTSLVSEIDEYQIAVEPGSPGHLYVFQVDTQGNFTLLFPKQASAPHSSGTNPVTAGQKIVLPDVGGDGAFFLDKVTGVEHVYAVHSSRPWPELETALARPQAATQPIAVNAAPVGIVQAPHGLRRGIGGIRPLPGGAAKTETGPANPAAASSGGVLVVERWFKHVGQR